MNLVELAKETGINLSTLHGRWRKGLRGADLTMPVTKREPNALDTRGLSRSVVHARLKRGLTGAALVAPAAKQRRRHRGRLLADIAAEAGVSVNAIVYRIEQGLTGKAVGQKSRRGPTLKIAGRTVSEIAKLTGLSEGTIRKRIADGLRGKALLKRNPLATSG